MYKERRTVFCVERVMYRGNRKFYVVVVESECLLKFFLLLYIKGVIVEE